MHQLGSSPKHSSLWPEIEKISAEQIKYALQEVGSGSNWHLFAEEGEMKLYKREEMVNGMVMDPLKACHVVQGVTGHEMCHYFFSPDVRMEWESKHINKRTLKKILVNNLEKFLYLKIIIIYLIATLDSSTVIEALDKNTLIFYQVHKRIWPASQRDAVFWSHKKSIPNQTDAEGQDIWTVTNHSVDLQEFPVSKNYLLKIFFF